MPSLGLFEELFVSAELLLWGGHFVGPVLGKIEAVFLLLFSVTVPWIAYREYRRTQGTALPILCGAFFGRG